MSSDDGAERASLDSPARRLNALHGPLTVPRSRRRRGARDTGIDALLAFSDAINIGANAAVGRVPLADMIVRWAGVAPAFKFGVLAAALCRIWTRAGRDRP